MNNKYRVVMVGLVLISICAFWSIKIATAKSGSLWTGGFDRTNNTDYWEVNGSGYLLPGTTSNVDIGSATLEVEDIFAETITLSSGLTTASGSISAGEIADITRAVPLPITTFTVLLDPTNPAIPTISTTPGLEFDNNGLSLVWADGETSKAMVTFRVPDDYSSGGAFRVFADENANSTRSQIDWETYVNSSASPWDTDVTNQTPAALAQMAGTPEWVTLSVATDFASLAGGQTVTFRYWRDDVATGTNDLEVSYAEFYYTASQ